jgi:hypothetical protein
MTIVENDKYAPNFVKSKCYVQVKVEFEYFHDKPHEPIFKTLTKPFYIDKLVDRPNLAQSMGDVKKVI